MKFIYQKTNSSKKGGAILIIALAILSLAWQVNLNATSCKDEGKRIGHYLDVPIYANGCDLYTHWQCTEFAKRFYFLHYHFNSKLWSGNGNVYHTLPGLVSYKNGETETLPREGDTIAFGNSTFPHVAIVSRIDTEEEKIFFHQQNYSSGQTQTISSSVNYTINSETQHVTLDDYGSYKVNGWGSPRYSVPVFSQDGQNFNAVYGLRNSTIYARINALNDCNSERTFDYIGIGGDDGDSDITIQTNYSIPANSKVSITGQRMFDRAQTLELYTYVKDGEVNQLENVVNRRLRFDILENSNSKIIDDSERNRNFECSDPIGITISAGDINFPKHWNLSSEGYLYGSIVVKSDSKALAQWKPRVRGRYSIEVFVPYNGCNAKVQYKIKPDGTTKNEVMSNTVDQAPLENVWVALSDTEENTTWDFSNAGYVGLYADFGSGKKVGFDAVKL